MSVDDLRPGEILGGRYEIIEQLGQGGMARVYRAHDPRLGRDVAVKVLSARYAADPTFVERFRREASAAAQLNHLNIVQVFDRGEAGGTYFIVMEHLPGPDLKQVIRRNGPMDPLEAVDNALQILAALAVAHRNDVIHRDVKPQNVLRSADGTLKVTDFGIARAGAYSDVTEAVSVIGTAQYLSPEQARGGEVTPASDCYSVGIVLYEMLTGRVPFDGERPVVIAMKQINEPPVDPRVYEPGIPQPLEAVVLKALAKRPSERYRTAEEFTAALLNVRAAMDGATGHTIPMSALGASAADQTRVMEAPTQATRIQPPPPQRPGPRPVPPEEPPRRRSATPIVVALIVLLGLLAVGAFALLNGGGGGGDKVTIPDTVIGLSAADAQSQLKGLGLESTTELTESSEEDRGNVVETVPGVGSEVDKGSTVTLRIGGGPAAKPVPNVVNLKRADATAELRRNGFKVKVQEEFSDSVAQDVVIRQNPPANDELAEGGTVTIFVSKGTEKVKVPDLRQKSVDDARKLLEAQGLTLGGISQEPSTDFAEGTIIRQTPAPTTNVDRGTSVSVVIAQKPEQIQLPSVIDFDATTARDKLTSLGFEVLSEGVNDSSPAGTVVDQSPAPDTFVEPGSTVTITVSLGPATDTDPSLPSGTSPTIPAPQSPSP
ncbi:MAG: Stk1 family PASTA domain-containing Ser/Thr kinase [Thermoleophilia bacterium]